MRRFSIFYILLSALGLTIALSQAIIPPSQPRGPTFGTRDQELPAARQKSAEDPRSPADLNRLKQDAKQLAELSASLPADMDRVSKGMLPKDVIEKLKQVEKISKRLRSQLTE
jgi:hypothetical protein